jgi:hypothetical protein
MNLEPAGTSAYVTSLTHTNHARMLVLPAPLAAETNDR